MYVKDRIKKFIRVPASELIPNPRNWRTHPEGQRKALSGVLDEIGIADAVIARETPEGLQLIDGHLRRDVMHDQNVPVLVLDVTAEEADKLLLTIDPLAAMATQDSENLFNLLDDVRFSDADVNAMLEALANDERQLLPDLHEPLQDPEPQIDRAEELQEKWGTERGQIWQIGPHRLMCGDNREAAGELFLDRRIDMCFTSPPYSDLRDYESEPFDWEQLMVATFRRLIALQPIHIIVNLGLVHKERAVDVYWRGWLDSCLNEGWPLFGWYVWDKGQSLPGNWNGRLAPAHEFVFHFNNVKSQARKWVKAQSLGKTISHRFRQKDGSLKPATSPSTSGQEYKIPDSVIRTPPHKGSDIGHPAMMGVGLAVFCIETWATENVYDPFLGSGTTMVAAEQLGRVCYGMEIEPKYVAVTLERMADMGLLPELTS